jgi:hypothetical protein
MAGLAEIFRSALYFAKASGKKNGLILADRLQFGYVGKDWTLNY